MNNFDFEELKEVYALEEKRSKTVAKFLKFMTEFDIDPVLLLYKSKINSDYTLMLTSINGEDLVEKLATTIFEECLRQNLSSQQVDEILNRVAMKVVQAQGDKFYE